jgi:hypothetical protein
LIAASLEQPSCHAELVSASANGKIKSTTLFNTYDYPTPKSAANAFASLTPVAAKISTLPQGEGSSLILRLFAL